MRTQRSSSPPPEDLLNESICVCQSHGLEVLVVCRDQSVYFPLGEPLFFGGDRRSKDEDTEHRSELGTEKIGDIFNNQNCVASPYHPPSRFFVVEPEVRVF